MSKSFAMCVVALGCGSVAHEPSMGGGDDQAQIRVAHVSPGAPAVDFCLAPHGTASFTGPVLAGAGRATGLSYATVTRYFSVDPGQYDVRLVAPGAADCKTPLAGLDDFTKLPMLAAGTAATIAAEGMLGAQGAAAFTLRGYADDTAVDSGQARLRFIHASPGTPAVDTGTGGGALFTPVFVNLAYGAASTVTTAPLEQVELSARAHGTTSDVISALGTTLPAGAIATAFAIGELGNADTPLKILLCTDNAEPNGVHSICSVVGDAPARARVRIAHLSPDTPAVDVCLAPAGTQAFGAPLVRTLAGDGTTGLSYPQVTGYLDLPAASYDVRVVHASTGSCATPSIPDTKGVALAAGQVATIAAIGDLEPAGAAAHDAALHLAIFNDAATPPSDQLRLRFIHASPGTPAVDVGTGSGAAFQRVFANVAFGGIATHVPLVDGYVQTAPFTNALTARLAGGSSDALTTPHLAFTAGTLWTAFAIGGKTGQAENPLRVLLCNDNRPAAGLLAACTIAP